jgi:hypothetical protein
VLIAARRKASEAFCQIDNRPDVPMFVDEDVASMEIG